MKLYRNFTSQEEIDKEYNVAASVPDMAPYIDMFVGCSERARQDLQCSLDVSFGPTMDETLDIFPADEANAPVVVFIHGGYWRQNTSKEFSLVATGLQKLGMTVVVTNYSLCPKVTISEITRQSRAAIAWVYREIKNYNGNPERIFAAGHSAGGQQVGLLLNTDWPGEYGLPANLIKGGIPISGVFDLKPLYYSWLQPALLLTHEVIMRESANVNIPDTAPPILISYGNDESAEFHRQSRDYLMVWQAKGLTGELWVQEGKNHFTAIEGFMDADSPLCKAVANFIAKCG